MKWADASIINQHVDGAKDLQRPLKHAVHSDLIGNVNPYEETLASRFSHHSCRIIALLLEDISNDYTGAFFAKPQSDGLANATCRTGHNDDFIYKTHGLTSCSEKSAGNFG